MVASTTASVISRLPKAAAFVGGAGASNDLTMTGNADVYVADGFTSWPATNANGNPHAGGAPFPTSIMAKGSISGAGAADLALGTGHVNPQSLGVIYGSGGSVSLPAFGPSPPLVKSQGNVPDLTSYLSLSDQLALEKEARSITDAEWQATLEQRQGRRPSRGRPPHRPASRGGDWSPASRRGEPAVAPSIAYGTYDAATKTFTANKDLVYTGNLTLTPATPTSSSR